MTFTNQLPLVISCCFCCFLRGGTIMIALVSFCTGLLFAPNVSHAEGFWNMNTVTSHYGERTEAAIHLTLGWLSVFLCVISLALLVGALFNVTLLIHIYIYGLLLYSSIASILFLILASLCMSVHLQCVVAGVTVIALVFAGLCFTFYFILVANSLRVSIIYLKANDIV